MLLGMTTGYQTLLLSELSFGMTILFKQDQKMETLSCARVRSPRGGKVQKMVDCI